MYKRIKSVFYTRIKEKIPRNSNFIKKKQTEFLTIYLTIQLITIGVLLVNILTPHSEILVCQSLTPWDSNPLDPNETKIITFSVQKSGNQYPSFFQSVNIANGQRVSINITSTNQTTVKIIQTETWDKGFNFSSVAYYSSNNLTFHIFSFNSSSKHSIFYFFIQNLEGDLCHYSGSVIVIGFNHDYYYLPLFPLIIFSFLLLIKTTIRQTFKSFKKIRSGRSLPTFLERITHLWRLNQQELGFKYLIAVIILIWFIVEPLVPIFDFVSSTRTITSLLRKNLIDSELLLVRPLYSTFFLFAFIVIIESAELVAGKINRRDIMALFSLPISRVEWVLITILRLLTIYGGIFTLFFLMKAFLISRQLNFFFPIVSITFWLLFFHLTFLCWVATGFLVAFKSHTKFEAAIKGLTLICILSFVMWMIKTGTMAVEYLAFYFWSNSNEMGPIRTDISFKYPVVLTLPNIDVFLPSLLILILWLCITTVLLLKSIKQLEIP